MARNRRRWMSTRIFMTVLALVVAVSTSFVLPQPDALAAGGSMTNGGNYTGTIARGQVDQWTFTASKGDSIVVTASEVGTNSPFYPYLQLQAPDGRLVINNADDITA